MNWMRRFHIISTHCGPLKKDKRTLKQTIMGIFKKLFGGNCEVVDDPQTAIQKLRETEEMLERKGEFLEKKINDEILIAKQNGTKNKRGNDQ